MAIDEEVPFLIQIADGRAYRIRDRCKIALGRYHAVVLDNRDLAHVVPLRAVTSISFLKREKP
jgi:hypothetical protein